MVYTHRLERCALKHKGSSPFILTTSISQLITKKFMPMKKIILLLLFCFVSMSFHDINRVSIKKEVEKRDTSFLHSTTLNDSILYLALVYYDVKHPKTVLAQAKLESGNYTSRLHRKNNNFLGLYNSRRGEYFKFNHWTDCIKGYKNMVEYKLRDGENYYRFLVRI